MAGSQLKQLKATLKAHNLTGQTNGGKRKKNSKRQPKQYDREEREKVIAQIRESFSPFEVKKIKNKRADESKVAVGKPGISKQIGEEQRKKVHEAKLAHQNKSNRFLDKRFGERNKDMSEEDRMLERFTRERQSQSRTKNSLFDLNDEDEDDADNAFQGGLTHLGEALHDDFDEGDLGLDDEENGAREKSQDKRTLNYDEDGSLGEPTGPARKKTKAEVMKEIIAKSKFYKQERQKAQEKLEDKIDELDEDFDNIFSELKASAAGMKSRPEAQESTDKEYDIKVKELTIERRAAPSDRTKTEEEIKTEAEEKRAQLERQRTERMSGMLELEDGEEKGVEDLDDGFWANSDEEEGDEGIIANSDEDIELEQSDRDETELRSEKRLTGIPCPSSHEELLDFLKAHPLADQPKQVRRIIHAYQPKLAEGNKERLGELTAVLLQHILFLSNQNYSKNVPEFAKVEDALLTILRNLSGQHNQALSKECRSVITAIQERLKKSQFTKFLPSDLVFFNLVGVIFSTSDQYHLVVTPCSILIAEILEQTKFNTTEKLAFGAALVRTSLQYQRVSKRYIPEVTFFFEKCLASLLYEPSDKVLSQVKIDSEELKIKKGTTFDNEQPTTLRLHQIFEVEKYDNASKCTLLMNVLQSLDVAVSAMWKELPAFQEITLNVVELLEKYVFEFPSLKLAEQILEKIRKLRGFSEHTPLILQHHRPVSIPSHAPKFEENFNPDKKSYDPDKTRSEINKMKSLLKKERKFTMKEIRKDTKFEARQRIASQKESAAQYHSKMAHIFNTISTEEGSEKNKYEREKKLRSSKK